MAQLTYQTGDATRPTGKWGKGFVMALSKRWSEPQARYRVPPIRCSEGIVCDTLVDAGVDVTVYDLP